VVGVVVLVLMMMFSLGIEWFPRVVGGDEDNYNNEVVDVVLREQRKLVAGLEELNEKLDGIHSNLWELREEVTRRNQEAEEKEREGVASVRTKSSSNKKPNQPPAPRSRVAKVPAKLLLSPSSRLQSPSSQPTTIPGDTDHCWANSLMILSSQRSGTHFLKSLLSMHPKTK